MNWWQQLWEENNEEGHQWHYQRILLICTEYTHKYTTHNTINTSMYRTTWRETDNTQLIPRCAIQPEEGNNACKIRRVHTILIHVVLRATILLNQPKQSLSTEVPRYSINRGRAYLLRYHDIQSTEAEPIYWGTTLFNQPRQSLSTEVPRYSINRGRAYLLRYHAIQSTEAEPIYWGTMIFNQPKQSLSTEVPRYSINRGRAYLLRYHAIQSTESRYSIIPP